MPVTIPAPLVTSEGVLAINNSEEILAVIHEVVLKIPEMQFFNASPCTKNTYDSLVVTGIPATGFRQPGTYRKFESATLMNRTTKCAYLDASWAMDRARATQNDRGKEFAFALQTKTHLQSAFFTLSKQIWYGTASDAEGFTGLRKFISDLAEYEVDAGGTGSDLTSVYFVSTSEETVQLAWGNDGKIDEGDVFEQMFTTDTNTKGATHYAQTIAGWCGLQIGAKWCAGRIKNLSAAKPLNDDLIFKMLEMFPAGQVPQAAFMSRRSLGQLRSSRTATNATGAPAPIPEEVNGVPLITTDAISNKEETLNEPTQPETP